MIIHVCTCYTLSQLSLWAFLVQFCSRVMFCAESSSALHYYITLCDCTLIRMFLSQLWNCFPMGLLAEDPRVSGNSNHRNHAISSEKLAAKIARKNHRHTQLTTKSLTWQKNVIMRYAPLSLFSRFMINKYEYFSNKW